MNDNQNQFNQLDIGKDSQTDLNEVQSLEAVKNKSKWSFVLTCIFFAISLIFIAFVWMLIGKPIFGSAQTNEEQAGNAVALLLGVTYFIISLVPSILTIAFGIVTICKTKKYKISSIVFVGIVAVYIAFTFIALYW